MPVVLPIDSISASKAAHALWLCLVLVAACAHSAQVNFSRVTGYQLFTWTPSVVATHKVEKSAVEREAPWADCDDGCPGTSWKDVSDLGPTHYPLHHGASWFSAPAYSQPPIRAPPLPFA